MQLQIEFLMQLQIDDKWDWNLQFHVDEFDKTNFLMDLDLDFSFLKI